MTDSTMEVPVSPSLSSLGLIAAMIFPTFFLNSYVCVGKQRLFVTVLASRGLVILIICLDFHVSVKNTPSSAVILGRSQSQKITFGVGNCYTFR